LQRHLEVFIDDFPQLVGACDGALGHDLAVAGLDDKPAIDQFVASVAGQPLHHQHVGKRHIRTGRGEPAAEFVVGRNLRLQVEDVHDPPICRASCGEREQAIRPAQPVGAHRGLLIDIALEPQWSVEQASAKADIGEVGTFRKIDLEHHVYLRPERAFGRRIPAHAPTEPRDRKADRLQRGLEQRILLETISTAVAIDQLCLQGRKIKPDRTAQQRVDAFKRDGGEVRGLKGRQCFQTGFDSLVITDALQVFVQSEFARHYCPIASDSELLFHGRGFEASTTPDGTSSALGGSWAPRRGDVG